MKARVGPEQDWTVVLRRQAARIVAGQAEGGYTDAFEIICCDCGDDPALGDRGVSPELQLIHGPYQLAAGPPSTRSTSRGIRGQGTRPGGPAVASVAVRTL